jgi:NAD(P)-dependent dehydrogenase (short-subunit alcohol dehydrogenase family)
VNLSEPFDFPGKVAVVTGGSSGIGRATVERLARGGASVVFCSHDAASVEQALREMGGLGDVDGKVADVSRAGEMESLMRGAAERFSGIDLLACCAGIQRYGTVEDTDESVWDEVLAVNLKGCYLASRYAIPEMRRRGGGAIVHVSSVQALACQTNVAAYAASKGGLNALTRSMALDFANDRIRVNAVCPGSVDTPMLRASAAQVGGGPVEDVLRAWGTSHPLGKGYGRVCSAAEVADVIAFLLSDRASFMTGTEVKVEGGLLARLGVTLPPIRDR